MQRRLVRCGARCAAALGAFLLLAAAPPPPPPPFPPAGTEAPAAPAPENPVEQRISSLQAELQITQAQMPQWNAFAQAMRDNAASTDSLFSQRAGAVASMNALQNMQSYAQVVRDYANDVDKLTTAFAALYGVLSDQQKQHADALFHQPAGQAPQ